MTKFLNMQTFALQPDLIEWGKQYQFQEPDWKFARDQVTKLQGEMESLSLGLAEILGARIRPFAHQAEVVERVLGDPHSRYLLADEVGLGKTIEASVILKALQKRYPDMKTLIIVPRSIVQQWKRELGEKFWVDLPIVDMPPRFGTTLSSIIVPSESLLSGVLSTWLPKQSWDMLIVDEAHRLTKQPDLYRQILEMSRAVQRCLILSATPIQRRSTEFLQLLCLMDPSRYELIGEGNFKQLVENRGLISKTVAYLTRNMRPEDFDAIDFVEEIQQVIHALPQDHTLANLVAQVSNADDDNRLQAAHTALGYISENYRIERRAIRNRRASLQAMLPERSLNVDYRYIPQDFEAETLETLYQYMSACLKAAPTTTLDYSLALLNAAGSSPHALLHLINLRLQHLNTKRSQIRSFDQAEYLRGLEAIVRTAIEAVTFFDDEPHMLEHLADWAQRWKASTDESLQNIDSKQISSHRLVQVLRAIGQHVQFGEKTVVFSSWEPTCILLGKILQQQYDGIALAQIYGNQMADRLRRVAEIERFQTESDCLIMLISDEFGSEGHNFQVAKNIIHVDLPWTPARLEQRIGRVDRLGRRGVVTSVVPYAIGTMEEDLFRLWADALRLFSQSMSGMEIVLEELQDRIGEAVIAHSRDGLAMLFPDMQNTADQLREQVDEERYFEEAAIDYQSRNVFDQVFETFHNGENVRHAVLNWARLAAPKYSYPQIHRRIITFNLKGDAFLKLRQQLPTPPEANRTQWRDFQQNGGKCKGTFDSRLALRDPNLFFFAPGTPLVQWIVSDALQSQHGRCSANWRLVPELDEDWIGFEFFYKMREGGGHHVYVSFNGTINVFPESIAGRLEYADYEDAKHWRNASQFAQTEIVPGEWRRSLERAASVAEAHLIVQLSKQATPSQTKRDQPPYVLESLCFWILKKQPADES